MNFFVYSPQLEAQIKEIRRKLHLSMNGVVSEKMVQSGIKYKTNYGLTAPQIKMIASQYNPSKELAIALWRFPIREMMLLAIQLMPPGEMSEELAVSWMSEVSNIEMAEQLSMHLFSKLHYAPKLVEDLLLSESEWCKIAGILVASRIYDKLSDGFLEQLLDRCFQFSLSSNIHLYRVCAVFIGRVCRKGPFFVEKVEEGLKRISRFNQASTRYIDYEVRQELLFLNNL